MVLIRKSLSPGGTNAAVAEGTAPDPAAAKAAVPKETPSEAHRTCQPQVPVGLSSAAFPLN